MPEATPDWTQHPELVEFYSSHRNKPDDLYPSERRFLPWLARRSASVLDTGCAAGGFRAIWDHFHPGIVYRGVELSAPLVDAARRIHPGVEFLQGNASAGVALPDACSETVQALGWLCWDPDYPRALRELWRLAGKHLLFDLRLVSRPEEEKVAVQRMTFTNNWDGATTTPYVTVSWETCRRLIAELDPRTVFGMGYWGAPAATVVGSSEQVCFATFVLGKTADLPRAACFDGPADWPALRLDDHASLAVPEMDRLLSP